jgi:GT2 family glycosyltransferase
VDELRARAKRILSWSDAVLVENQNVWWIAGRFGIEEQLISLTRSTVNEVQPPLPMNTYLFHMPRWRRRVTTLWRTFAKQDPEAYRRFRTWTAMRLPPGMRHLVAPKPKNLRLSSAEERARDYAAWVQRYDKLTDSDRALIEFEVASAQLQSVFVVLRFGKGQAERLAPVLSELQAQIFPNWRALLIVDDLATAEYWTEACKATDDRMSVLTPAQLANGRCDLPGAGAGCIIFAEGSARFRPHTLYCFAAEMHDHPAAVLLYADHDHVDKQGKRHSPALKPDFSPELNQHRAYLGNCVCTTGVFLKDVIDAALGDIGVAEWAAWLASRVPPQDVRHIARILYHSTLAETVPARRESPVPELKDPPVVGVVIPTKNKANLLAVCVESLLTKTEYPKDKLKVIIIDNGSDEAPALELLNKLRNNPQISVVVDGRKFNYSRLNNVAVRTVPTDVVVMLNNDTEITDPNWLSRMVGFAIQPDVGVVGLKLLYEDGTIQHGGVVLGVAGVAQHSFIGLGGDADGYLGLANVAREVSAVTGACMAIRRSVLEEAGGLDEELEVAFNDTALCLESLRHGYRNLYVGDAKMLHHESRSRPRDDAPEHIERFRQECIRVRAKFQHAFKSDSFYNPSLSLEDQYGLAVPRLPRLGSPIRRRVAGRRVLILSSVHGRAHGVAVVAKQHAEYLAGASWSVFIGGPLQLDEITYEGCSRVYVDNALQAQSFAFEADIDCVVAHTIPFISMVRNIGISKTVIFDHGEPPAEWFPHDAVHRKNIDAEKRFCYALADLVMTNTASVKDEIGWEPAVVAGLGNSHLSIWDAGWALRRAAIRKRLGLDGKFVVLNVCRFHAGERVYKGVDEYAALREHLRAAHPELAQKVEFVLCGRGSAADRLEMERQGLVVHANVTDQELIDLYVAADLYVNFSKWEGYNLGIGQALALGLEVIASDIPAHRRFPISVSNDLPKRAELLLDAVSRQGGRVRTPVVMDWAPLLADFEARLRELCDA